MNWVFGAIEELTPVVAFFVAVQVASFSVGILVMIVVTAILLGVSIMFKRKIPKFAVFSAVSVLGVSVVSLLMDDYQYFMAADTFLDGFFAGLLLLSLFWKKTLLQTLFERVFAISDKAWRMLTLRWGIFLLSLAILNEVVRLTYSADIWTYYKLISTISILLFGCYQFTLSAKERIPEVSNKLGLRL